MQHFDRLWRGAHLATLASDPAGSDPWGIVRDGAIGARDGRIAWLGPDSDVPAARIGPQTDVIVCPGRWVTPGLVDCHTHLVFGGDRSDEWERRLAGDSYEAIAREGGGIASTVRATRSASEGALMASARARALDLMGQGVTTLEVKSGYGLDLETELRMLRVARRLGGELPVSVRTTFLGAHALPQEFAEDRTGYLEFLVHRVLPAVVQEGLADQVDAFLEGIAFTAQECARVLEAGRELGLGARLHADQLSDGGGAELAARLGAASADHLEWTSEAGARAMGASGTVAVLLPGAFLSLGGGRPPPVGAFRSSRVRMAVATDLNPGSSPLRAPLLALNLACTLFGLTPAEAVMGATRNAAPALGLSDRGVLREGLRADLAIWDIGHPRELAYWLGYAPSVATVLAGVPVTSR